MAKQHTEKAVLTLVSCLRAPRPADRITAATALLDRGWGRPVAMVVGDPNRPLQIDFKWADDSPVAPGAPQPANPVQQLVLDAVDWSESSPDPGNPESK